MVELQLVETLYLVVALTFENNFLVMKSTMR